MPSRCLQQALGRLHVLGVLDKPLRSKLGASRKKRLAEKWEPSQSPASGAGEVAAEASVVPAVVAGAEVASSQAAKELLPSREDVHEVEVSRALARVGR